MSGQNPASVPLTVCSGQTSGTEVAAVIGSNRVTPPSNWPNSYWYLVVDRTSLQVVVNVASPDPADVPAAVSAYANNSQYMLIFLSSGITINLVPQGALYQFLVSTGASTQLARLEQINLALSSGTFTHMSYVLVGQMASGSGSGFEASSLIQSDSLGAVLTLQLLPVVIDGVIYYTPIELGE